MDDKRLVLGFVTTYLFWFYFWFVWLCLFFVSFLINARNGFITISEREKKQKEN